MLKPGKGGVVPTSKIVELFSGTIPTKDVKAGEPANLIEAYGLEWSQFADDVRLRPDHYTPREIEIIGGHERGGQIPLDIHYSEMNELAVKFHESTQNRNKRQEVLEKITKPKDIADDPNTITEESLRGQSWSDRQATFENQSFGDDLKTII